MKKVKIIIATHKKYRTPQDKCYLPLHVGAKGKKNPDGTPLDLGYVKDNTGDNISAKNASFCELTGLYWAWKNLDADYIGLAHYRRHFCYKKKSSDPFDNILNESEVQQLVDKCDVIVPAKRHYYIETLYSHYAHTHYVCPLSESSPPPRILTKRDFKPFLRCLERIEGSGNELDCNCCSPGALRESTVVLCWMNVDEGW